MRRGRMLAVVLAVSIGARFLIKNPEPPKGPDRTQKKFKYVPGMLDNLPAAALAKMNPTMLAQIRAADAKYKSDLANASLAPKFSGAYQVAEVPLTNPDDEEAAKQMQFLYEKRRIAKIKEERMRAAQDITKKMLVIFRRGGAFKVENVMPVPRGYRISMDNSLHATMPHTLVSSVMADSADWKRPIPKGQIELKPAHGITITVAKETAKRITVKRQLIDET